MLRPVDSLEDVACNVGRDKALADCKRKKEFRSKAAARNWVIAHQSKGDPYFKSTKTYQCPICNKWHLTTKRGAI